MLRKPTHTLAFSEVYQQNASTLEELEMVKDELQKTNAQAEYVALLFPLRSLYVLCDSACLNSIPRLLGGLSKVARSRHDRR